jgi:hypothetical protein
MFSEGTPSIGARVVTIEGEQLGTVKEVSGACFKVDAPMQPDYWLASDCIESMSGSDLRLNVPKQRIGDAKLDSFEHSGIHRHT